MTNERNERQLASLEKEIASIEAQVTALRTQSEKLQGQIGVIYATRGKALRDVAAGDARAGDSLDSLDTQERNLNRQITGTSLLIDEKNAALAKLKAEAAPIVEKVNLERFHKQASAATEATEKSFMALEEALERASEALARYNIAANEAAGACIGRPEGADYRNKIQTRTESLRTLMGFKLDKYGWRRVPQGRHQYVPPDFTIPAALPPEKTVNRNAA
jgi:chromosome segregation ATPase